MTNEKQSKKSLTAKAAALVLLPLLAGCGGNGGGGVPALGSGISLGSLVGGGQTGQLVDAGAKAGSTLMMNEGDEDEMGRAVAIAATNQWPLYDNAALTKYVTMVGLTLADVTPNPSGNWVFGVLDTPDLGAYSGPNGYVMVTRGAIAAMRDESELAGVLAHEMSHVLNHDGLHAVKNARLGEAGLQGLSAADQRMAAFSKSSDFLVNTVIKSGWSQGQETSADSRAVQLLQSAGYDAGGLARFLQRMEEAKGGPSGKAFGTHPGTAQRVGRISSQAGNKGGATQAERFAKAKAEARL
jgi:predicted Zn-dependent protease